MRAQLLTSAVALMATVGSAHAADIYTAPPTAVAPAPAVAAAPLWTGPYGGAFVGHAWGDVDFTDTGLAAFCDPDGFDGDEEDCPATFGTDIDGWLGGLFFGYNWQTPNNFVFGVEADVAFADIDGMAEEAGDENPADAVLGHIDAIGTLRGRVGYAFGNFLLFGTGGLAVAHLDHKAGDRNFDGDNDEFVNWDDDEGVDLHDWDWGWTIGGGAEFAINETWSVRGDYLYVDLGDEAGTIRDSDGDVPESGNYETTFHVVRVGVAAHF